MAYKPDTLTAEAQYFHLQIFKRQATPSFIQLYQRAHAEIPELNDASSQQYITVKTIINKQLDAPGIEVWLRDSQVRHLLTRKLLLIAYIAECDAGHYEFKHRSIGNMFSRFYMVILTGYGLIRLIRGFIQKTRYGLL